MTLTELIIASVLVGIVTLGLIAAEQAIRMSRQSSNRDAQISAQMQAAMIKLSKDASFTVGDSLDSGIYQSSLGNNRAICFRQAQGDANTYTDDSWSCWTIDTTSGLLLSCLPAPQIPVDDCTGNASEIEWVTLTNKTFYSVFDDATPNPAIILPAAPWYITNSGISYIQIDLTSRFNPAVNEHPIENPEYALTTRISPPGLSR